MLSPQMKEVVDLLRSGTVIQRRHALGDIAGERCCLGVICDVAVKHGVIPKPNVQEGKLTLAYDGRTTDLPPKVRDFFNLADSAGVYNKDTNSLMGHNDSKGDSHMTFAQIADLIESEPEGLFEKTVDSESTVE